jgi:tetratricopeptide (TPR) repeat protein
VTAPRPYGERVPPKLTSRLSESAQEHAAWLLGMLVVILYLPSVPGDFLVYDDVWLIEDNPILALGFREALIRIVSDFGRDTRLALGAEYLPLRDLSYYLDVHLLGLGPSAMRVEQILVYVAAVVMLRAALLKCLPTRIVAEVASACFALHPVHVESVAWIAGRKDVLGLFFIAAALWAYEGRRALAHAAVPLLLAAHFCNSMSLVAVGLLLAQDLLAQRRPRWIILCFSAMIALLAMALHAAVTRQVSMFGAPLSDSRWAAFCTMGAAWLEYLRISVWPASLSVLHEVPLRDSADAASLLGWALLAAGGAYGFVRVRSNEPFALGVWLWAIVPLVPVSQLVFPLQNVMADRYLWLSVLALGLVLGAAWVEGQVGQVLAGTLLTVFSGATVWRAAAFGDGAELFARETQLTSGAEAPYQWARTLDRRGDRTAAEHAYRFALERPCGGDCEPVRQSSNNLAQLLVETGRVESAEPILREAVRRFPNDPKVHFHLVDVLERLGKHAEARVLHAQSARLFPDYRSR